MALVSIRRLLVYHWLPSTKQLAKSLVSYYMEIACWVIVQNNTGSIRQYQVQLTWIDPSRGNRRAAVDCTVLDWKMDCANERARKQLENVPAEIVKAKLRFITKQRWRAVNYFRGTKTIANTTLVKLTLSFDEETWTLFLVELLVLILYRLPIQSS